MNITKQAQERPEGLAPSHLEDINRLSRRTLGEEEVYVFSLRLCDNEVDRDQERFPRETLEELAPLFVGKSGLFDHSWSARGQAARIYRTEVVEEPERRTRAGDEGCWLKGWAYMIRTAENESLIAEIEGGIKKEVSVGCAVERAVCSICGAQRGESCGHTPGQVYDGKLCWTSLEGATDAYEFSFVAVPAQPMAGVVKGLRRDREGTGLRELAQGSARCVQELEQLEREAGAGRRWLESLRGEVIRLGGLADPGLDLKILKNITQKLGEEELRAMRETYEARAAARYPLSVQLSYEKTPGTQPEGDGAFLI